MSVILTILLTVLKIIGIALLVILGLVFLILLLVLLVPVRYDIRLVKETPKLKEAWAQGSITWLLRLIALEASYKDGVVSVFLRVLKFTLKEIRIPEKAEDEDEAPAGETTADETRINEEPLHEAQVNTENTDSENTDPENTDPENSASEGSEPVKTEAVKTEPVKTEPAKTEPVKTEPVKTEPVKTEPVKTEPVKTEPAKKAPEKKAPKAARAEKKVSAQKKDAKQGSSKTGKIGSLIASIPERIADLIQSVFDTADLIDDKLYKAEKKIGGLLRKAEPFISEDARGLYARTIRRLLRMLKHFLPKKLSGYVHFGTGAPDLTGELTGLIYLVLPAGSSRFSVEPEFNDTVLETDCCLRGHVRFIHALVFLIRMVFDREVWRLLRAIRGKNKKARAK